MNKWLKNIGPGPLVAAAFIGPGTVTLCTIAGVDFGYSLLWALMLSVVMTIILQEMSARIGLISQMGISEIIRNYIKPLWLKQSIIILTLIAIFIGNAAYEAGNISGAVLGLQAIAPTNNLYYVLLIGGIAFVLLYIGNYKVLEKSLIVLVLVMSISFITVAIWSGPKLMDILEGLFNFKIPENSLMTIVGLIGTTVVPYNIFLHASLVKEKWKNTNQLKFVRIDTILAVFLGGLVSICIVIATATLNTTSVESAADLALALEPIFGTMAKYVLAIGLFAAGITSAVTAPLAAGYVVKGCLGWKGNLKSLPFRAVCFTVLFIGILFSSIGFKSIEIIKIAQFANGLLLPIIAIVLLVLMNKKKLLGRYANNNFQNIMSAVVICITLILGIKSIWHVFS